MSALTDFLRARITEREAMAEHAVIFRTKNGMVWIGPTPATATVLGISGHRLFSECVAQRGIVDLHRAVEGACQDDGHPMPCPTLRLLALPDADHPDYPEELRLT